MVTRERLKYKDVTMPRDGVYRMFMKSDPATSSVLDRKSVEYAINSEEGIKYYHFFKYMLLPSEEHHLASLFGNWYHTQNFVRMLPSINIYNTFIEGSLKPNGTARTKTDKSLHASYLRMHDLEMIKGLSEAGVFFARKFTSNQNNILDVIDSDLLNNSSFPHAAYIYKYFEDSKRKSESIMRTKNRRSKFLHTKI